MLKTKADLRNWLDTMLPTDQAYLTQAGGAYLASIREFEAVCRPLWALVPLACGKTPLTAVEAAAKQRFVAMVAQRRLPELTTNNRQIAVELGVIGYALGIYGQRFLDWFAPADADYFCQWLTGINQIQLPKGNWYFFLVLVNTGLAHCGKPCDMAKAAWALQQIDQMYLGHGWYRDGDTAQSDYYVPFAFHFYGLLYASMVPADGARFIQRAAEFAPQFVGWFDGSGRSVPFGRSLTYRFAHVAFFSALVTTGAYRQTALSLGQCRGLILRHLRWWQQQPIITPGTHNLSIGYGYAQQLMSEDYNAPGSPMWAFKALILLALDADAAFWQAPEEALPSCVAADQREAGMLVQQSPAQTTLLSSKQYAANGDLYHWREKYTKFAYNSYFGFNIGRAGDSIGAQAVDSTLLLAPAGSGLWQTRGAITDSIQHARYSIAWWQAPLGVRVITYLIPVAAAVHIRIHIIKTPQALDTAEGGFPLADYNRKYHQPLVTATSCCLTNAYGQSMIQRLDQRTPQMITQGPNTNLYNAEKNAVPALVATLPAGRHVLGCVVSAVPQGDLPQVAVTLTETHQGLRVMIDGQALLLPLD